MNNIPFSPGNGGLPGSTISGLTTAGTPGLYPSQEYENVAQLLDNVTFTLGNHALKAGVNLQRIRNSTLQPSRGRGNFSFTGMYSDSPSGGGTSTTGSGIVDFLEDHVASATINNLYTTEDERFYDSAYLQDDWKVTPKFTLNLGVRWEYVQPFVELHDHQGNFIPGPYTAAGPTAAPNYMKAGGTYLLPASTQNYPLPAAFIRGLTANKSACSTQRIVRWSIPTLPTSRREWVSITP